MHYSKRDQFHQYVNNPQKKGLTSDQLNKSKLTNVAGCDDLLNIYIKVENNKIEISRYDGNGCAISVAATEALLKLIEGKTLKEVGVIINLYTEFINGNGEVKDYPELEVFEIIQTHVSRKKCAMAPVNIIKKAIEE